MHHGQLSAIFADLYIIFSWQIAPFSPFSNSKITVWLHLLSKKQITYTSIHKDCEKTFMTLVWVCFAYHTERALPTEHEISLRKKATLSQSELIQTFFISFDECKHCSCSLKANSNKLTFHCTFQYCAKDLKTKCIV